MKGGEVGSPTLVACWREKVLRYFPAYHVPPCKQRTLPQGGGEKILNEDEAIENSRVDREAYDILQTRLKMTIHAAQ